MRMKRMSVVGALVLLALSILSVFPVAEQTAEAAPTCINLGAASDFNVFVFGNMTQSYTESEGRVAVGGNANLTGYGIGDKLTNSNGTRDDLIVGGNVFYNNGQVFNGNAAYGGATGVFNSVGFPHGSYRHQGGLINFATAQTDLLNLSSSLAGLSVNGTTIVSYGSITLNGSNPTLNVFKLSGSVLASAYGVTINVPAGSTVIVNIDGTTDQWQYMGVNLNGATASNVLYNFYQATSLTIQGIGIQGSILAPKAALNFNNGQITGTVIAASLTGYGEFHLALFKGCLPPPPPPPTNQCATLPLGVATDYNLFTFGDVTQINSDTEGRMAIGGKASLTNYGVGDKLTNSAGTRDDLIVQGTLTYTNGQVFNGNAVSGGAATLTSVGIPHGSYRQQSNVINFAAAQTQLNNLSTNYAALVANGSVNINGANGITLTGSNANLNVFNLSGAALSVATSLTINVPSGSTVLVNVSGASVSLSNFQTFLNGVDATKVLYNFYQATTLNISSFGVLGSVLAPNAALTFNNGQVDGTVVVKSLSGTGEFHHKLFKGCLPA